MGKLKQQRMLTKISKGLIGWHCEWCGKEMVPKKKAKPKDILKAARDHNQNCEENPLVKQLQDLSY